MVVPNNEDIGTHATGAGTKLRQVDESGRELQALERIRQTSLNRKAVCPLADE